MTTPGARATAQRSDAFCEDEQTGGAVIQLLRGDCRDILPTLPERSVQTVVTSPPYFGLRDYGVDGQIGMEPTIGAYVDAMVTVFRLVWRVLRDNGTLWLNLGDAYANDTKWGGQTSGKHARRLHGGTGIGRQRHQTGLPPKSLMGLPWRVALTLQDDGWILRNDIIWSKPNSMPESATDRCTKSHEYLFLFAKSESYYFDQAAIAETVRRSDRPQYQRAVEIALEHGLTNEHIDAIRAAGLTDTGKNAATQTGTGANSERVQALAAEAKAVLKGYYREFLAAHAGDSFRREANKRSESVVPGDRATHRPERDDEHCCKLTRNRRSVWTIPTRPYDGAHFAVFPELLVEPCVLAGSRPGDTVLDPFAGTFTVGRVALRYGRQAIGIELNPAYCELADERTNGVQTALEALL